MTARNFENHFKDLFENTHDLIYFLTIEGEIDLANPAFLSTLGYKMEEIAGKNIYDFIHHDYAARYRENRADVIKNNRVNAVEVGFLSKTNELIIGEGQVGCSYKDGLPQYTRCVFKNTTRNQEAKKLIKDRENRLKAFLESGPDAVIIINENQEILEWNSKAETIFGFTREEIKGKSLTETIIPPQYRQAHLKGMERFLSSGSGPILNKTVEVTALHKNGREFYINLSISNVKIDDRWIFIAFLSDISERKKTEEQLIKKEAELMQSKLMEEEKDKFISIASHELKTPITTIKAYTQLILGFAGGLPEDAKKYLSKIEEFTNKLTFLLNELLDVSKINQGQLHLSKSDIHFDDFLQEALNSIQQITPKHSIVLEENAQIVINADAVRLEQVITNLISNAAKYSPGKDKIVVKSFVSQTQLIVSVTDGGIGIAEENKEKIFQRFYRVKGMGSGFNGFGIGLYVSSEIIKQHGGRMWVESKEKEGSTFYFSLPL